MTDIIRQEARVHEDQRLEHTYQPASDVLISLMFPKGEAALTFVPLANRKEAWELLKNNLLPVVLPILMGSLLDSDKIEEMLLKNLEGARDKLNAEVNPDKEAASGQGIKKSVFMESSQSKLLGEASGALVVELINMMNLPASARDKIIDSSTNKVNSEIATMLGQNFVEIFNSEFIETTLKSTLSSIASRDENGSFALKYEKPLFIDESQLKADRVKRKQAFHRVSRELAKAALSNYIRVSWVAAQSEFDRIVENRFGNLGSHVKTVLDAVFRFVFITVIGTILSILLKPVNDLVQETIFKYFSLDENLQSLLAIFSGAPEDQPEGYDYNVYNENLVYNLVKALVEAVKKESSQPGTISDVSDKISEVLVA